MKSALKPRYPVRSRREREGAEGWNYWLAVWNCAENATKCATCVLFANIFISKRNGTKSDVLLSEQRITSVNAHDSQRILYKFIHWLQQRSQAQRTGENQINPITCDLYSRRVRTPNVSMARERDGGKEGREHAETATKILFTAFKFQFGIQIIFPIPYSH